MLDMSETGAYWIYMDVLVATSGGCALRLRRVPGSIALTNWRCPLAVCQFDFATVILHCFRWSWQRALSAKHCQRLAILWYFVDVTERIMVPLFIKPSSGSLFVHRVAFVLQTTFKQGPSRILTGIIEWCFRTLTEKRARQKKSHITETGISCDIWISVSSSRCGVWHDFQAQGMVE